MKKIIKSIVAIVLLQFCSGSFAQDLKYTQYFYSNPLKVNPASLGMNTDFKTILNYRTQWANVDKGFSTASFTAAFPLYFKNQNQKMDFGLTVLNDKAGAFNKMDFSLSVGYNLKVSESGFLSFSVIGGYVQKSLDQASLTFDDQYVLGTYDAANATSANISRNTLGFVDLGFGMMWYMNDAASKLNAYAGFSTYHLNKPNETYIDGQGTLPMLFGFQTGVKIKGANSKVDFTPNVNYIYQANNQNLAVGLFIDYHVAETSKLRLGLWYRTSDAIAAMISFDHNYFMFAYSYDMANANLSNQVIGLNTHEITLAYKLNMAKKKGVDSAPSIF